MAAPYGVNDEHVACVLSNITIIFFLVKQFLSYPQIRVGKCFL